MFRPTVFLTAVLYGLVVASGSAFGEGEIAPLRDQLVNGLKATRPEEKVFIDHVVIFVDAKKLELSTVNAAFKWARKRKPIYPFPYFERAIRILAAREGVQL